MHDPLCTPLIGSLPSTQMHAIWFTRCSTHSASVRSENNGHEAGGRLVRRLVRVAQRGGLSPSWCGDSTTDLCSSSSLLPRLCAAFRELIGATGDGGGGGGAGGGGVSGGRGGRGGSGGGRGATGGHGSPLRANHGGEGGGGGGEGGGGIPGGEENAVASPRRAHVQGGLHQSRQPA